MPASKEQLAKAIIESYFNSRKDYRNWQLIDQDNALKLPTSDNERGKINTAMDVLAKSDKCFSNADWLSLIYELHQKELDEQQTYDNRYALTKLVVNPPMMIDVLRAIREILLNDNDLLHKLNEERNFLTSMQHNEELEVVRLEKHQDTHSVDELKRAKEALANTNARISALNTPGDYRENLFNKMKDSDPSVKELEETCYADFAKNVGNGKRKTELTDRIMRARKNEGREEKAETASSTSALRANSTFKKPAPPTGSRRRHRSGRTNHQNSGDTGYSRRRY